MGVRLVGRMYDTYIATGAIQVVKVVSAPNYHACIF